MSGLSLLAPLGLAALVAVPVIVLLYMRTTTPTERRVPSTRFWLGAQTTPTENRRFRLPPTAQDLKSRLVRRAEDSEAVIAQRLRNAAEEFQHWNEYDYILVNRDLQKSFERLRAILTAERLKRVKMPNLKDFVDKLLTELKALTP